MAQHSVSVSMVQAMPLMSWQRRRLTLLILQWDKIGEREPGSVLDTWSMTPDLGETENFGWDAVGKHLNHWA